MLATASLTSFRSLTNSLLQFSLETTPLKRLREMSRLLTILILLQLGVASVNSWASSHSICDFDDNTMQFAGSPVEQARCLLRPADNDTQAPARDMHLPPPFETLLGKDIRISKHAFREYLIMRRIEENAIGGNLDLPVSHSAIVGKPAARYFVIHDTSINVCEDTKSLATADSPDASWNQIGRWNHTKDAHLFITRDGKGIRPQGRDFSVPWRATKLEMDVVGERSRGIFLHVENVQLRFVRLKDGQMARLKDGKCRNDSNAQSPGFTEVQYDRLSLAYLDASIRAGRWLVPAYHVALDRGISEGHDDPRNFDLAKWGATMCAQLQDLGFACK